ncbi:hypothetical protein EON79_11110, partial [bacterium]
MTGPCGRSWVERSSHSSNSHAIRFALRKKEQSHLCDVARPLLPPRKLQAFENAPPHRSRSSRTRFVPRESCLCLRRTFGKTAIDPHPPASVNVSVAIRPFNDQAGLLATMSEKLAPPAVRWDLSALASGLDDPRLEEYWQSAEALSEEFATRYRDKVAELSATEMAEAIGTIEAIYQTVAKPGGYASLRFSTDSGDPAIGAFLQKQRERGTGLSVKLMFFELELQAMDGERVEELLSDPALADFAHFVRTTRTYSPFRLSEAEEVVLEETANTGSRAWQRLHEELLGNHKFHFHRPGKDEVEEMTEQDVLSLLRDADRLVRQAAADSLTSGLAQHQRTLVFLYNTLLADKATEDRLRNMEYPEQSRHLSNELDKETVDLVIRLCREHYPLVARFYEVKREILGLPELTHIDRYAPLFEAEEEVSWEEGRKIVVDSFAGFSEEMARRADEFFTENWIDAEPRA